jgi:hypothetical protein
VWWCEQSPEPSRSSKAAQKKLLVLPQIFLAVADSCLGRQGYLAPALANLWAWLNRGKWAI